MEKKTELKGRIQYFYNRKLLIAAVAVWVVHVCYAVISNRFYYADGSFFLVNLINQRNNNFPISDDASVLRYSANLINQLPAIICLKLGIKNIVILNLAFGLPLFLYSAIGFVMCRKKAGEIEGGDKLLLFPLAGYAFFCLPSDIFAINQAFSAYWIYNVLLFYIISPKNKLTDKLVMLVLLVLAAFAHETILVVGPVFLVIAGVELAKAQRREKKIELYLCGLGILAGVIINVFYMRTHVSLTGSVYLEHMLSVLRPGNLFRSNMLISVIGLILVLAGISRKLDKKIIWCVAAAAGILYVTYVHHVKDAYSPFMEYCARGFITVGAAGAVFLTYLYYSFQRNEAVQKICFQYWRRTVLLVLILQCFWQIGNTHEWNEYYEDFKSNTKSNVGIFETVGQEDEFAWDWNQSSISLLLSKDYEIKSLMEDRNEGFKPYIENNQLWIPFMWVDSSVFDISPLLEYEQIPAAGVEDCGKIDLICDVSNITMTAEYVTIKVVIKNNSDLVVKNRDLFVSYHIYDENECVIWDGTRTDVTNDILPGGSVEIEAVIDRSTLEKGKQYTIRLDIVKEYQYWFGDSGMDAPERALYVQ